MRRLTVWCRPRGRSRGEVWLRDVRTAVRAHPLLRGARLQGIEVEEALGPDGSCSTRLTVTFSGTWSSQAQRAMVEELDQALADAGEEAVGAAVQELVNHALQGAGAGGALGAAGGGLGWRRTQAGLLGALAGGIAGALIGYAVKSWVTVLTGRKDAAGVWRFAASQGDGQEPSHPGDRDRDPADGPEAAPPG